MIGKEDIDHVTKTLSFQVYLQIASMWECILTLVALVLLASDHLAGGGRGRGGETQGGGGYVW